MRTAARRESERNTEQSRPIAISAPRSKSSPGEGAAFFATPDPTTAKAPTRRAEQVTRKRPEATATAPAKVSARVQASGDRGKTGSGSKASSPSGSVADLVGESEDGTRDRPPITTGKRTRAQAPRVTDTSRLYEGLEWEYCGLRPARLGPAVLPGQPGAQDQLFLSADTFDYDRELDLLWLEGDVRVAQGSRGIAANKIVYDRGSADLVAKGDVFLANPGVRLVADKAQMNLGSDKGSLADVHYRLTGKINARGSARQAELVSQTLTKYREIVYTTCRPGQNAWALDAGELELDQATGWGVARDAKLRVRGLPVLYTPYLSFPIDDRRKSGILVPTVGNSDTNGIDVTVPYYWNIAPNMDATISPRYMSKRGLMLGTELRYLSQREKAEIYGEIVPDDSQFQGNNTRWGYRIEQRGHYGQRWTTVVNYNTVSDDQYLEDFGNRLELTSTRNIERRGDLTYGGDGWYLVTRLRDFQTVDVSIPPQNRPYGQLPQLLIRAAPYKLDSGLQVGVGGEYDYFQHSVNVHGSRTALQPFVRWPLRKSYGHLIPQLNLYLAGYDLQNQEPDKDDRPSYAIPSFNLDAELIFERTVQWLGQESLQTLEPRIYYLYTPYKDQEDQPVFDSSELTLSYYSLFQPNRFTGWDRIGDANQLTLALTSRTLARRSGRELLRASIGQTLYFRDREVQISGPPQDAGTSPISGLLSARLLANWTGRASFEYDPSQETDRSLKRALEIHYETQDDRLFNLAYRFDLGTSEAARYENTDLSFRVPVNRQLNFVGRWNYSLLNSETVEAFAGVEYGQCCWRMRLVGQHLKNKPDTAGSTSVMVQVELAGLGTIGQKVDKLLARGIYGYHVD
jgi:LPS-assembly protein